MRPDENCSQPGVSGGPDRVVPNSRVAVTADDAREQLTRLWQSLLGIDTVGAHENYFELGGDSILAVNLFAEISKRFGVKLSVATLYEAPTIDELARLLSRELHESGTSRLVPIQPNGLRPPFFCVHGAGGNVLIYRGLARHLGPDQPFYGLQSQGLDGACAPLTRVEEMAALYVKDIRKLQPRGPYYLGGYCGGGTIAFEVAQQLRGDGEEVALLALFDTSNWSKIPDPGLWGKAYYGVQRLVFHGANFLRLNGNGRAQFLHEKWRLLKSRTRVWRGMIVAKLPFASAIEMPEERLLGHIWQANDRACAEYLAKPYPGVITDFRPAKQYRRFDQPNAKWGQLALRGEEVCTLPVYPAGMLVEPLVKHLAEALRKSIDEAIRRGDGGASACSAPFRSRTAGDATGESKVQLLSRSSGDAEPSLS